MLEKVTARTKAVINDLEAIAELLIARTNEDELQNMKLVCICF